MDFGAPPLPSSHSAVNHNHTTPSSSIFPSMAPHPLPTSHPTSHHTTHHPPTFPPTLPPTGLSPGRQSVLLTFQPLPQAPGSSPSFFRHQPHPTLPLPPHPSPPSPFPCPPTLPASSFQCTLNGTFHKQLHHLLAIFLCTLGLGLGQNSISPTTSPSSFYAAAFGICLMQLHHKAAA